MTWRKQRTQKRRIMPSSAENMSLQALKSREDQGRFQPKGKGNHWRVWTRIDSETMIYFVNGLALRLYTADIFWVWPDKIKRGLQRWRNRVVCWLLENTRSGKPVLLFWQIANPSLFHAALRLLSLQRLSNTLEKCTLLYQGDHPAPSSWWVILYKRQKLKKKFKDHITEHLSNNWGRKKKTIIMPEQAQR